MQGLKKQYLVEEILNQASKTISKIKTSNDYLKFEDLSNCDYFKNKNIELIKEPKWADDALLVKFSFTTISEILTLTLKLHEDKYPLASHIYDSPLYLKEIAESGLATHIYDTCTIKFNLKQYRIICYDYIQGKSLGKTLNQLSETEIVKYKNLLNKMVSVFFKIGFNVFVRDLDDFRIVGNSKNQKVILTDYNALMECKNSNKYSRTKIMEILTHIIDKLVSVEYKPFV